MIHRPAERHDVRRLNLRSSRVTDAGLANLEGLEHLRLLLAEETDIIEPRTGEPQRGRTT